MKTSKLLLGGLLFFCGFATVQAQETRQLTLDEAIGLAVTKSTEATLADTKVSTSQYEMESTKNNASGSKAIRAVSKDYRPKY